MTDQVAVPVQSLDEYIRTASIERVDFLKVDVEGAEWDVLRGATRLLQQSTPPILQLEVNPGTARAAGYSTAELLYWLGAEFGYAFYRVTVRGQLAAVPQRAIEGSLQDIYALHPERHADRITAVAEASEH